MQIKVTGANAIITPVPDPDNPIDPGPSNPTIPTPPPTPPPAGNTRMLSAIKPVSAGSLHPGTGQVLQCLVFVPALNQWFSAQAMPGQTTGYDSTMISRMASNGTLIDSMKLLDGGHGTSIGIEVVGGAARVYTTYQAAATPGGASDDVVYFPYQSGVYARSDISGLTVMPHLDAGYNNVQFDWDNDYMVVRNSSGARDSYIRRKISEWKAGTDVKYGQINLTQAPPSLQGFCTLNDTFFRYVGSSNGELLKPPDLTYIEQYDWISGRRIDKVNYMQLGKSALGTYPGGTHEPEGCTMYRESDGTGTLVFCVTLNVYGAHSWPIFKLPKIGSAVAS